MAQAVEVIRDRLVRRAAQHQSHAARKIADMVQIAESGSYQALRLGPGAAGSEWWSAARRRADVPPAVGALLSGRSRVEVTQAEAVAALAWAGRLDGWNTVTPPLFVYDPR
jgi:hypothetical protein